MHLSIYICKKYLSMLSILLIFVFTSLLFLSAQYVPRVIMISHELWTNLNSRITNDESRI